MFGEKKTGSMTPSRREVLQVATAALATSLVDARAGRAADLSEADVQAKGPGDQIVIACAGDFFLTEPLPQPVDDAWQGVAKMMGEADLSIANLENGLSTTGAPELGNFRQGPSLRGHPSLVGEIGKLGIRAVSLANNHTGNYGREALLETISTLDRAGIPHAGAGRTIDAAWAPALFTVRGQRVALFSVYSYYYNFEADDVADANRAGIARCRAFDVLLQVPGGYDTTDRDKAPYLIAPVPNPGQIVMGSLKEDVDRLSAAIVRARSAADVVIITAHLHWGRHTRSDLPEQQRAFARAAIDSGADLFFGHGPHTIRGVELYKGKPIVYSLGNFVLLRSSKPTPLGRRYPGREGLILRATFKPGGGSAIELVPIVIGDDCRPRLASGADGERIAQRLADLSAALGTTVNQEGSRVVSTA
jgi:poly-gamma-glutamate capsule biosynthesis protein CapA/YwtB (metallophosphatase superfamily)